MMNPTKGRIVYYYDPAVRPLDHPDYERAAIVTHVHEDGSTVDLTVFGGFPAGPFTTGRVPRHQEDQVTVEGPFWNWMPYQVQKAKAGDHNSESAEPRPQGAGTADHGLAQ